MCIRDRLNHASLSRELKSRVYFKEGGAEIDLLFSRTLQFSIEFVIYAVLVSFVLVTYLSSNRKTRSSLLSVIHLLVLLANEEKT